MPFVAHPLIIAHRGASAEKPENTLAAFRRALALRVDGIELDVRVTRDGVPVVFHDDTLRRLTGIGGTVAGRTWRELTSLRVRRLDSIPRLTTVLRLTRQHAIVQIEIKSGVRVAPVIKAIRSARAVRWVILASFDQGIVGEAWRLAPAIPRMLISGGKVAFTRLVRQLTTCGAAGVSVNAKAVQSAAWVQSFQELGYSVWCWTVNDVRRARCLAGWGIDALLTDDPVLLQREL